MLPLLRVIDVRSIVVIGLAVFGLFMVFVQGGVLVEILAEMLSALSPF